RSFACGRSDEIVRLFEEWLPALAVPHHHRVTFNSLCAVVFWLSDETTEPPDVTELAREIFNARAPSESEITQARALFDAFCLNLKGWSCWEFVGRRCQMLPDQALLESERARLGQRFAKVKQFHRDIEGCFLRPVSSRGGGYYEFEPVKHRQFVD